MDTDWCLHCGRRVEGNAPYCSQECFQHEQPFSLPLYHSYSSPAQSSSGDEDDQHVIYHDIISTQRTIWQGNGPAGIRAWARDVPSGPPEGASSSTESVSSTTPTPQHALRTPKLLLPHQRPMPPTLCMSTPQPARPHPSLPITTPQQQIASLSLAHSKSCEAGSMSSMISGITESFVATPTSAIADPIATEPDHAHKPSVFGHLATQVRSWCSPSPLKCGASSGKPHLAGSAAIKSADPSTFTVLAKAHPAGRGLVASHDLEDVSETGSDEGLSHGVWWVSSSNAVESESKLRSTDNEKLSEATHSRSRRLALSRLGPRDDHPAYHSRGRKHSRAIS